MPSLLTTKLRRDLGRQRAPIVAVALTVLLGVALFGAAFDAYRNLTTSYAEMFDQLRVADVWVTGGDTTAIAEAARGVDGVGTVATRTQVDVPFRVEDDKLSGRVVGLPASPSLNEVAVESGQRPGTGGATPRVLAERHLAREFGLSSGDTMEVQVDGTWQPVEVAGSASSAEYLWLARSSQEVVSLPDQFGVVFAPQAAVERLTGAAPNQVLVRFADGAAGDTVAPTIEELARQRGALDVHTWAEQPSNAALQEDISGFSQMALLFPLLFLTAAAMAAYTLLARRILVERSVIGMLRAQGVAAAQVRRHYVGYGLVAGLAGAVPGALLGMVLARALTSFYVGFLELPVTAVAFRPMTPLLGVAFGAVTGVVAAWVPARAAARTRPAEAMRGIVPASGGGRTLLERLPGAGRLPASARLVLRSITRNRRRTAMTVGGVTLALLLVLVSWSMLDTVQANLDRQFEELDQSDAQVLFSTPDDSGGALEALRGVDGVARVEPSTTVPVSITGPDGSYATVLQALPTDSRLRAFDVTSGTAPGLNAPGLLVGTAMRGLVGAEVGETLQVTATDPATGQVVAEVSVPVAGFVREALGTQAWTSQAALTAALGRDAPVTGALVAWEAGTDAAAVQARVEALDVVGSVQSSGALRDLIEDVTGLLVGFITIMLVCGGVLAATMIFTTVSVSIAERATEVATLRASGVPLRRLARLVTIENLLVAALGVVPGLLLGVLGGRAMMSTYSTDQFTLTFVVDPTTLVASAGAILLVAAASQVPGLRNLRRIDLAATVRERAA